MKILVIGPYGLGNTILTLPAIQELRKLNNVDRLDFVSLLPSISALLNTFAEFKVFNKIYSLNIKNKIETIKKLLLIRKQKYDYSVLMFPSARIHYNILSFLMGAKNRIASLYPDINFRRGHFFNNINIPVKEGLHDVFQNIRLLRPFGISEENYKFKNIYANISLKNKKKIIGIHPGSKRAGWFKKWDKNNYVTIIKRIITKTDYSVKIFFGPDEIDDFLFFYSKLKDLKNIDFIINKSLSEVIKDINQCKIFLSNDSGLMHIANFLKCYNIIINGPSDFRRTAPMNKPYFLIYNHSLKCIPCSHTYMVKSHKFKCIYNDVRCIKTITVDIVWKELKKNI